MACQTKPRPLFPGASLGHGFLSIDDVPLTGNSISRSGVFTTDEQNGISPVLPLNHDDQIQKLEKIRLEEQKDKIELMSKLKIAQLEMCELMKTRGNDDVVLKKSEELKALRNQMAEIMLRNRLAKRAVYTDEQWEKINQLSKLKKFRHGGRHFQGLHKGSFPKHDFKRGSGRGYGR